MSIDKPRSRTGARVGVVRVCIVGAILVVRTAAVGGEASTNVDQVLPPGQEELLAEMLGRGMTLPGGCRFTGGGADGSIVTAEYGCDSGHVVVELRDPNAAAAALRTAQFGMVVRSGSAPAGLLEALAGLIRAHEAELEWSTAMQPPVPPFALVLGASAIIAITLLAQYLIGRRVGGPIRGVRPKPWTRNVVRRLAALGLGAAYLSTRLWCLTCLPVFFDEAIHIEWARASFGHYFIPEVSVGKWLPIQVMAIFTFLPFDALTSVRLASVSMGCAAFLACLCIGRILFSYEEGLLAAAVYTILPFSLLYDRLALADIYLTAFGAWSIACSLIMVRNAGVGVPMAMTVFSFAAVLSKPTGGLFLAIPLFVCVLLVAPDDRQTYLRRCGPTLIGGGALLLFLLHGGYGANLLASQSAFAGLHGFLANLETAGKWLTALLTPAIAWSVVAGSLWALSGPIRKRWADVFVGIVLLYAIIPYALVAATWYPRYLLFVTVPASLLLACASSAAASQLMRVAGAFRVRVGIPAARLLSASIVLTLAVAAAPADLALIRQPELAPLPAAERTQYVSGWAAGYGLPELVAFLREQARAGPINVLRFYGAGAANQGLDIYLIGEERLRAVTIDPRDRDSEARIARLAAAQRTLLVSESSGGTSATSAMGAPLAGARRLWVYTRPGAESRLEVWELPRPSGAP